MVGQDVVKKIAYTLIENRAPHYRKFLEKTRGFLHPLQALPHVKREF